MPLTFPFFPRRATFATLALIGLITCSALIASLQAQTLDEHGWTLITPSSDSRIIYVSNSEGDDKNDGLSPATAKKSIAAGNALLRDGFPDHLLLKRGDTFVINERSALGRWKNGRSPDEPILISYYGDSGPRPVIKISHDLINHDGSQRNYQALIGLDIYKANSDPTSPDFQDLESSTGLRFVGGGKDILVEDCILRFNEIVIEGYRDQNYENPRIRRNIILDTWKHDSTTSNKRSSGIYISGVRGSYLIEENFFDHNGWSTIVPDAGANMFSHNIYIQYTNVAGGIIRGNIITRGASHGIQARSGGILENNLFSHNAISFAVGGVSPPTQTEVNDFPNRAQNNVALNGRRMDHANANWPLTAAVWGFTADFFTTSFIDNIIAHRLDNGVNRGYIIAKDIHAPMEGNIIYRWNHNEDQNDPKWPAPQNNLNDYFANITGEKDFDAYFNWLRQRELRTLPWEMTAYAAINFIRSGFGLPPVDGYYLYDSHP